MSTQKLFVAAAVVVGLLITAMLVTAAIWPVINDVKTGATPEYPDVVPLYYTADIPRVFDESVASAETIERWKVTSTDQATRTIEAEATTRVFGFTDDITITISAATEFVTRVDVRSASRVGKGDFGQNARNIRVFFKALNQRLGSARYVLEKTMIRRAMKRTQCA